MHFYASSIKKENKFSVFLLLMENFTAHTSLWTLDASNTFCVFLRLLLEIYCVEKQGNKVNDTKI